MPNFKKDLSDGHDFEDSILAFVQIKYPKAYRVHGYHPDFDIFVPEKEHKIECKYDRMSEKTGNIAIEFFDRGKPSGIDKTKATHWIYKFHNGIDWRLAIGRVSVWREVCVGRKIVSGGDGWKAKMYLVPVKELERMGIKIRKG